MYIVALSAYRLKAFRGLIVDLGNMPVPESKGEGMQTIEKFSYADIRNMAP